ncbi:7975_t:CDS:2 [Cetraspora pellucida]|uniref:7975_t:CDS:1 n=1 Tax=Cetraspora pellucida TaxID=1433469 RepID=A0A9N9GTC9_9GLOM|nr:7975_t:CDS:2 [Cetraspora pellucida]
MDSMQSIDITEEESQTEGKLLKKIDWKIVPLITFLYMISYLDSIGNAKLERLESDLGLIDNQYNWWTYTFRIAIKFDSVFEAGLIPGTIYYISIWYKRSEQNIRMGAVLSGPTFAGALSGLLSYAIISVLDSKAGLSGWQWIFLVCGLVTIIVSIVAFFLISDSVEDAKWLNKEDRNRVSSRVGHDELLYTLSQSSETSDSISKTLILECLKDWRNVVISLMVGSGSIGGIIATQIYRSVDYPNYTLGHIISSICLFLAVCLSITQYTILKLKNKNMKEKRRKIRRAVSWNID